MAHRSRLSARLRGTFDRVLVHDIKNISFRLRLLLSNLEEHWSDPEFRKAVRDLLASSVERLEEVVGRFVAHEDAVLIKVELDVNGLLRQVLERPARRASRTAPHPPPCRSRSERSRASGATRTTWATPSRSLLENALEAAAPDGKVLVRSYLRRLGQRPRAVVEFIDNGAGMSAEFLRERLFRPFETTKPHGVGLGLATASQIVRFHRGTIRILSQPGGGTLVRVSLPGIAEPA